MDQPLLQSHPLIKAVPSHQLEALLRQCQEVDIPQDAVLLRPGQENQTFYLLLAGQLQVHLDHRGSGNSFVIKPGEIIGEMSIIERRPVAAWVVADQPSSLLAMPERLFWEEFVCLPGVTESLLRLLIARVRKTDTVLLKEFERKVHYEHLKRELQSAGKIQANILPALKPLFPQHPQVETHALIRPAREVGGDFYDAFAINDRSLCVAVGDVSGKGMAAALFMVRVITLLRICLLREPDPAAAMAALNRTLCEANEEFMFVSLAIAVMDAGTGRLAYVNGGHNPPFFSLRGSPFQLWDPPLGKLLGVDPDVVFEVRELDLRPGDAFVLYTDGVTEAENAQREQFAVERAASALSQAGRNCSMSELLDQVDKAIASFVSDTKQSDDITMLALRYRGNPAEAPSI